jgi:hypothetical protein
MDDAIVFDRLHRRGSRDITDVAFSQVRHARIVFYPPLLVCMVLYPYTNRIADIISGFGVLSALTYEDFAFTIIILCIYLSAMPAAIVMINMMRQRDIPIHNFGWCAITVLLAVEMIVLSVPQIFGNSIIYSFAIIVLTASLSHILFFALCSNAFWGAIQVLSLDIVVFIFVVILLVCLPFPLSP